MSGEAGYLSPASPPVPQVEEQGLNSLPLRSCTERPVLVGDGVPPAGDVVLFSVCLFDFGLNMPFWLLPSKVVSCFGRWWFAHRAGLPQWLCVLLWRSAVRFPDKTGPTGTAMEMFHKFEGPVIFMDVTEKFEFI